MEKITASIVLYKNEPATVIRAVESFLSSARAGELFIIDNSPSDEASQYLNKFQVTYIFAGTNLGYGKAHNVALEQCINHALYHLVLNPDVYFDPETIDKLFSFMEEQPHAGLVMPKVLYPDGRLQRLCKLLPTPLNLATRRFFRLPLKSLRKLNEDYEMCFSQYNKVINVPFLSGCFMFLRTAALKQTGLFDERYFLYAEDTDLSRRIHRQFTTLFYPFAEIYHTHARGSYKNARLTWYNFKSAVQYFNKWGWFHDEERKQINEKALMPFLTLHHYGSLMTNGARTVQRSMDE